MSSTNFGRGKKLNELSIDIQMVYTMERSITMKKIEMFLEELFECYAHIIEY
ncbi:MAG: hypothetical protein K6G03_09730 [Lachnospiraceae bacterium]|nr:hypothetical protein [Lachnospiraceae bacterium]